MIKYNIVTLQDPSLQGSSGLNKLTGITVEDNLLYCTSSDGKFYSINLSQAINSANITLVKSTETALQSITTKNNILYSIAANTIVNSNGDTVLLEVQPKGITTYNNTFMIGAGNIVKIITAAGKDIISYKVVCNIIDLVYDGTNVWILSDNNTLYIYNDSFMQYIKVKIDTIDSQYNITSIAIKDSNLWIGVNATTDIYKIPFTLVSTNVKSIYYMNLIINSVYKGAKKVWGILSSCFSSGVWNKESNWSSSETWKN